MNILVTGGLGYIGSHTCVELLNDNNEVIIIDNLSNSREDVVDKIEEITHRNVKFYKEDCRDKDLLRYIFKLNKIDAVLHFAGLKSVGESLEKPLEYYDNNIGSTIRLSEVMSEYDCNTIVFSSSANVYGEPECLPLKETANVGNTTNPYGTSKYFNERILADVAGSNPYFSVVLLRYFNPLGAHPSGLIGENPLDIPNNLMPYIVKVATKELPVFHVYGNDYDTLDGTGVRDYIHVVDLARGHIKALQHALNNPGVRVYNLGTGKGYSVLEVIKAFEKANNLKLNYQIDERRPADIAVSYADPTKANKELNWYATHTLEDMCKDSYNYAVKTLKLTK